MPASRFFLLPLDGCFGLGETPSYYTTPREIPVLQSLVHTILSTLAHGDSEMMKYHAMNSSMQCCWATHPSYPQNAPHPVDIFHALIGPSIILISLPSFAVLLEFHCLQGHEKGKLLGRRGLQPVSVSQERWELGVAGGFSLWLFTAAGKASACVVKAVKCFASYLWVETLPLGAPVLCVFIGKVYVGPPTVVLILVL